MGYDGMNRHEMQKMFEEFAMTLQDEFEEDWYATDREVWSSMIERFMSWKFAEEIAREQRYEQYLKLKQEFDDNSLLTELQTLNEAGE